MSDIEVSQLAYLKVDENLEIIEEVCEYYYCNDLKDSEEITGLGYSKLASLSEGRRFDKDRLKILLDEIENGVIIGQNINYDIIVLDALSYMGDLRIVPKYPLDIINQFSPKQGYAKLSWICNNLMTEEGKEILRGRFKKEKFHDALYDVYSVYALIKDNEVFRKRLKKYLRTVPRGV
jgi:hypothetical protein